MGSRDERTRKYGVPDLASISNVLNKYKWFDHQLLLCISLMKLKFTIYDSLDQVIERKLREFGLLRNKISQIASLFSLKSIVCSRNDRKHQVSALKSN